MSNDCIKLTFSYVVSDDTSSQAAVAPLRRKRAALEDSDAEEDTAPDGSLGVRGEGGGDVGGAEADADEVLAKVAAHAVPHKRARLAALDSDSD